MNSIEREKVLQAIKKATPVTDMGMQKMVELLLRYLTDDQLQHFLGELKTKLNTW